MPHFQARHYNTLAALLQGCQGDHVVIADAFYRRLIGLLAFDNDRFNAARFLTACGLNTATVNALLNQ